MDSNIPMQLEELKKIANDYIKSLINKNIELLPLADTATMTNALAPDTIIEGKKKIVRFMKKTVYHDIDIVNDKIEKYIPFGNCIAILWSAYCYPGNIQVSFFDYIEVENALIVKIKSYFDPRGLLAMLKIDPGYF